MNAQKELGNAQKEINKVYNQQIAPFVANNKIWLAVFGGAVAAIAIAAFIYPEKSKQLLNKAGDTASDLASKIGQSASTYAEKLKDTANDYAGKLNSQLNPGELASKAREYANKEETVI